MRYILTCPGGFVHLSERRRRKVDYFGYGHSYQVFRIRKLRLGMPPVARLTFQVFDQPMGYPRRYLTFPCLYDMGFQFPLAYYLRFTFQIVAFELVLVYGAYADYGIPLEITARLAGIEVEKIYRAVVVYLDDPLAGNMRHPFLV